ncbi:MAG: phosphatase PAP2 family protein [Chloroflexota bacterium]
MNPLLEFGLDTTRWLQTTFPSLAGIMAFISDLFLIAFLLPVIYWSIDKQFGRYIVTLAAYSGFLNDVGKFGLRGPRPFWLDPAVEQSYSPGYGVPSGHTQSAFVAYISLAQWLRRRWIWAIAILLVVLMGVSRIYLGTHFVHDVFGGFILGGLVLWLGHLWQQRGQPWVKSLSLGQQLGVLGGITAVCILLVFIIRPLLGPPDNTAWASFTAIAEVESREGLVNGMASVISVTLGFILESHYVRFKMAGSTQQRILRTVVGLATTGVVFIGMGLIPTDDTTTFGLAFRFVRFFSSGIWVSFVVPWLLVHLNLAERE